jgi:hypothetical protein
MAQNRWVSTNFWKDTYVSDLDPVEKLLFLYLLTNPRTNIAGIYEISIREMAFDTGIDKDMIAKVIDRFQRDKKAYYSRGWITMLNWFRHQSMNPKMKAGAKAIIDELPRWYREELLGLAGGPQQLELGKPTDSLSIDYESQSHSILFNSILFNFIKFDSIAAEPQKDSKKFEQQEQKSYADAVREDEALAERAANARERAGSTKSLRDIYFDQKQKRVEE